MNTIFWINYLIGGILHPFAFGLFLAYLLEPRYLKIKRPLLAAILMLAGIVPTIIRVTHTGTMLFDAMGIVQAVLLVMYLILLYRDLWWKKLLAAVMFFSVVSVSEAIVMAFLSSRGIPFTPSFSTYEMFLHQTLTCIMSLAFYAVLALVWKTIFKEGRPPRHAAVFMLFPISQMLVFWVYPSAMLTEADNTGTQGLVLSGVVGFAADIVLFYVLLNEGEKEEMERQLVEMQYLQTTEQQHFDDMEKQNRAVAKIRHDLNNQLSAARYLTENGELGRAEEMIQQIQDDLKKAASKQWCGNSVVNAVMMEKETICTEKGILLKADLELGEIPSVQPIHLCSVFSNLLDNAIEATDGCKETMKPVIELHAALRGDYLQIRISNPSRKPEIRKGTAPVLVRHGHGQEIVRDIAEKYKGSFLTDWKDGIYTVMLALEI